MADFEDFVDLDPKQFLFMRPCTVEPELGRKVEVSDNGFLRLLQLQGNTVYSLNLNMRCSANNKVIIDDMFDTIGRNTLWTITHPEDGYTYSVYYLNRPTFKLVPKLFWVGTPVYDVAIKAKGYRG